ncbi:hypothetical protein [Streptomyces mexicanus]|uniref:hypothetical protein n=1 Tax=Streptomyces mexicanus TaxID=178566 RepID=UPI0031ED4E3F
MTSSPTLTAALSTEHRARLMSLAREVFFDAGTRLFEEGQHADRFLIIKTDRHPRPACPRPPCRRY